jgi:hypothetical protein
MMVVLELIRRLSRRQFPEVGENATPGARLLADKARLRGCKLLANRAARLSRQMQTQLQVNGLDPGRTIISSCQMRSVAIYPYLLGGFSKCAADLHAAANAVQQQGQSRSGH